MANNLVVDPVCGTKLDSARVQFTTDYEGMRHYFCSDQCKHRFNHDPEAYRRTDLTVDKDPRSVLGQVSAAAANV